MKEDKLRQRLADLERQLKRLKEQNTFLETGYRELESTVASIMRIYDQNFKNLDSAVMYLLQKDKGEEAELIITDKEK